MASLERKSLQQPEHLTYRGSVIFKNPCASVPSNSISLTQSILRRQMDPTSKTKFTVERQVRGLNRVHRASKGGEAIWSPSYLLYRTGSTPRRESLNYTPLLLSGTFVESTNTSSMYRQWLPGALKPSYMSTGDLQAREKADALLRKLQT